MSPSGGFGGPPGGAMGSAFGGAMGAPSAGGMPSIRNPLMTLLIPAGITVGGYVLGIVLGLIFGPLAYLVMLIALGGIVFGFISVYKMLGELKEVTKDPEFNWWFILIPYFNYYWIAVKVPEQVTRAKQMVRAQQPARGAVVYFFLLPYALAADLNEIAKPNG
jgi:hypothetical protein